MPHAVSGLMATDTVQRWPAAKLPSHLL